jgi:acetolactate synthase small subunit
MLVKVAAPVGAARTEVLQIAQVFRARICDMGADSILMTVVGDPGKVHLPLPSPHPKHTHTHTLPRNEF